MGNCFGSPQDYYLDPEARAEYERQVAQQKAARKQRRWFGKHHSPKTQPSESSKVDKDEDEDVNTL
ncbi:hypothetical protein BGW42_000959 [Actinomortierella wolfii]|nr:hypothetical protein BGW42_000959 [Actinomortierella wolfii]